MGSDSKPIHIAFDKGMDQSLDEFAVPVPGNIRHAINTRTRRGGSIEQRRGVHGFQLSVPSLTVQLGLSPTGVVELARAIAGRDLVGISGKAYVVKRGAGVFCGVYGDYLPVRKQTEFSSEDFQYGVNNLRACASVVGSDGSEYIGVYSRNTNRDTLLIEDSAGGRIAAFGPVHSSSIADAQLVASPEARLLYAFFETTTGIRFHQWSPSDPSSISTFGSITRTSPVFYAAENRSGHHFTIAYQSSATGVTVQHWAGVAAPAASVTVPISPTTQGNAKPTVFTTPKWTVVGILQVPTGSPRFAVMPADLSTVTAQGALATGINFNNCAAPLFGPTENPDKFVWALGRANQSVNTSEESGTLLGTLGASGAVKQTSYLAGVLPVSEFDDHGSSWFVSAGEPGYSQQNAGGATIATGVANVFSRFGLLSRPHEFPAVSVDENERRPKLQLSTERVGPRAVDLEQSSSVVWKPGTNRFSSVGKLPGLRSVLLPTLVRSQDERLYLLERYDYQHSSQFQARDSEALANSAVAAGQPFELFPSAFVGMSNNPTAQNSSAELGFFEEPQVVSVRDISGDIEPGVRLYVAVYEWISPTGERHRSRPSQPFSVTRTTPGGTEVKATHAGVTARTPLGNILNCPVVHIYRTTAGGKTLLRVTPDVGAEAAIGQGSDSFVVFEDTLSDAEILSNEVLYTQGGVQPNDLAPPCRFVALGEDRLWVGGLFESDIIQASKKFVPREPVRFSDHDSFKVRLPFACTGLAYLDGAVVAFCEDFCYLVSGEGPNEQGAGAFTVRPIADIGCRDYRSILVTSIGVFFQSKRSLQLMPRGFGPPEQIRNLNELMGEFGGGFTEVIGAALREYSDEETARFLLRNPDTNERIVAVFELGTKTWSYDVIKGADGNPVPLSAIGDGPEGVLYGAGSGTHRIMTELEGVGGTPYDSMGSTIDRFWSEVRLGRFQAFGPAGEGKLKATQLRGYSPATGAQVVLSTVSDYGTLTHTYSGIGSGTFFRRSAAGPNDASASEAQVSAVFRTGVGQKHGLRLLSLTLELEPTQGLRRARIGEQD